MLILDHWFLICNELNENELNDLTWRVTFMFLSSSRFLKWP